MRPFINWAKPLGKDSVLVFYKCPEVLQGIDDVKSFTSGTVSTGNLDELVRILKRSGVDYIVSDDYAPRVELLMKLSRRLNLRKGVYVQLLYGMHALMRSYSKGTVNFKSELTFSLIPLIPFRLLSKRYRDLLKDCDTLMANSHFTASILCYLYGLEVRGVLYPPVDEMIFRPYLSNGTVKEVVLYCGSNAGDTDPALLKQLLELLVNSNCIDKINLLGNKAVYSLMGEFVSHSKVNLIESVSDMELAAVYSKSILTISPQEWETFGYVPVESMLCGTPVLAFASQPSSELVERKETARLVYSRKAFIEAIERMLGNINAIHLMKQRCLQRREDLLSNLSCGLSADKLLSLLT